MMKYKLLYLNLYLANPYPAVVQRMTARSTAKNVTIMLLKKYLEKLYSE